MALTDLEIIKKFIFFKRHKIFSDNPEGRAKLIFQKKQGEPNIEGLDQSQNDMKKMEFLINSRRTGK